MATSNTPAYTHITLASALLVLCGVLPQSVSAAQTEVYGKLETSIRYMHVNGSDSGNKLEMLNEGSRWGLKIKEDLSNELPVRGSLRVVLTPMTAASRQPIHFSTAVLFLL